MLSVMRLHCLFVSASFCALSACISLQMNFLLHGALLLPTISALTCVAQAWVLNSCHLLNDPNSGLFSSESQ